MNTEDKITLEELSPSLQNLIKSAATKSEITSMNDRVSVLQNLITGVRLSVVDSLSSIFSPVNGKDMAIANTGSDGWFLYFYLNDKWNVIPTSTVNLNQEFVVTITQSRHQTITAECNGNYYKTSFKAKINSEINLTLVPDPGYVAGELSVPESFVLTEAVSISASEATLIPDYNINVTSRSHQHIKVYYDGIEYIDQSVTGLKDKSTFSVLLDPDYGWNAGELSISNGSSQMYDDVYMITGDTNISASAPSRKNYTVTVMGTEKQTIHFKYTNSSTGATTTANITTTTETFTLPYYSSFEVTATGDKGYLPGTLSHTDGRVESDLTISISSAQKTYNKERFESPGSRQWTTPSYITKVHLTIAGAGGGCHSEIIEEGYQSIGYYNGGNGELLDYIVPVTSSHTYTLVVGKAGTPFISGGGASSAFGITANGGGLDGTDAGNGLGGHGDTVQHLTGAILVPAEDGHIILEYGTNIEEKEVTI